MASPTKPASGAIRPAFQGGLGKINWGTIIKWLLAIIVVLWVTSHWERWTTRGTYFAAGSGRIERFQVPTGSSVRFEVNTLRKDPKGSDEVAAVQMLGRSVQWTGERGQWMPLKQFFVTFPKGQGGAVEITMPKGPIKGAFVEAHFRASPN